MSGFFFCGSIDDPVAKASGSCMKPNSSLDQSTISSPMRERCTCVSAAANSASATKSRSDTASSEFSNRWAKPRLSATWSGSSGRLEPASAPAPSGDTSARGDHALPALDVAGQRPEVREQVVREQDRLGPLQVGVAREVRVVVALLGPAQQHGLQVVDAPDDARAPRAGPRAAGRARPGRCGSGRCGAWRPVATGDLGDPALDRGVDVLVGRRELERAVVQLGPDPVERVGDREPLLLGEQADRRQHVDVRARAGEVVVRQPLVERQADAERHQRVGRPLAEAAVPERAGLAARVVAGGHRPPLDPSSGATYGSSVRWRRDHVSTDRPQSRTNPAASSWRNASSAS